MSYQLESKCVVNFIVWGIQRTKYFDRSSYADEYETFLNFGHNFGLRTVWPDPANKTFFLNFFLLGDFCWPVMDPRTSWNMFYYTGRVTNGLRLSAHFEFVPSETYNPISRSKFKMCSQAKNRPPWGCFGTPKLLVKGAPGLPTFWNRTLDVVRQHPRYWKCP